MPPALVGEGSCAGVGRRDTQSRHAEQPPLRVFFGSSPLQNAKTDYENRV